VVSLAELVKLAQNASVARMALRYRRRPPATIVRLDRR